MCSIVDHKGGITNITSTITVNFGGKTSNEYLKIIDYESK
jgi:hypothetical protein